MFRRIRKNNTGLKLVVISLVILAALGLANVVYARWIDSVTINAVVNSGTVIDTLTVTLLSPAQENNPSTYATCGTTIETDQPLKPDTICLTANNAQLNTSYYCDFTITNSGTIPVKIKSVEILSLSDGLKPPVISLGGQSPVGVNINSGQTKTGTFSISLMDDVTPVGNYSCEIRITVEPWNQP